MRDPREWEPFTVVKISKILKIGNEFVRETLAGG